MDAAARLRRHPVERPRHGARYPGRDVISRPVSHRRGCAFRARARAAALVPALVLAACGGAQSTLAPAGRP